MGHNCCTVLRPSLAKIKISKMGKISEHVFRVLGAAKLAEWYKTVMGMEITEDTARSTWSACYPGEGVKLVFQEATSGPKYTASRESCYWKIGVTVRDLTPPWRYSAEQASPAWPWTAWGRAWTISP